MESTGTPLSGLDSFLNISLRKCWVAIMKEMVKENKKKPVHLQLEDEDVARVMREYMDDV